MSSWHSSLLLRLRRLLIPFSSFTRTPFDRSITRQSTLVLLIGWCSTEDEVLYKRFVVEAQGPQGPLFGPFRGQKEAYVG